MKAILVGTTIVGLSLLVASQFVSVFVVQPIGALPEGRTVIITRLDGFRIVDSADAWCERNAGGVSLLCRGLVIARIGEKAKVVASLPYSETLYDISTGGKRYDQ